MHVNGVITEMEVIDVRFPTSSRLDGSDAMNVDPDYSAAYVVIRSDGRRSLEGHGFTFTIGRGTEVVVAAIRALEGFVVGRELNDIFGDMGAFARGLVRDTQLRWIGPEKGAIHMATAAVLNAVWDMFAKSQGRPLWKLLSEMSPESIADLIDFRYIDDVMDRNDAVAILKKREPTRNRRRAELARSGYPAYTTSAGWLGYSDRKLRGLCRSAVADGWQMLKIKVGSDLADDQRRMRIVRDEIGPNRLLAVDANQAWGVSEAIEWTLALASFDPYWVEEPTSPDDILGLAAISRAVAPTLIASGEHVHNRVMFKQLLQSGGLGICQVDACRLAGVNEVVAVLLMAAKFGVPVCPHAGGVGLCELVQHISAFDFIAVSGSLDGRVIEYVDHLHQHFVDPVRISFGRYLLPEAPGYSAELHRSSLRRYRFPDGPAWNERLRTARPMRASSSL